MPGVHTKMLGGSCAARPAGAKAASDVLTEINSRKEKEHRSSVYTMAPAKQRPAAGPRACPLEGVRCVALGPTTPRSQPDLHSHLRGHSVPASTLPHLSGSLVPHLQGRGSTVSTSWGAGKVDALIMHQKHQPCLALGAQLTGVNITPVTLSNANSAKPSSYHKPLTSTKGR